MDERKEELNELVQLVFELDDSTKPGWGQMSAQHMVEHLVLTFRISNGKLVTECAFSEGRQAAMKRFLNSDKPMPRDFTNPLIGPDLKPLMFPGLDVARNELIKEVEDFYRYFDTHPESTPVNPTFGPLTFQEWLIFHRKHMTHHLTQFSLH